MAMMGMIGGLLSGVFGAIGAIMQGNAAAAAAEQNARIADYNRQVAERNKIAAMNQADAEARDVARSNRRQMSQIRAAYGASGLALEGSPLDVLEDTALEQELDVQKTRYKGQLQAIGYADEEQNYKMKAELHRMEAKNAKKAGMFNAAGSFFGAVGNAGKSLMSVS